MNEKQGDTIIDHELLRRKDEIKNQIVTLFENNMQVTDCDVAEANDNLAAKILIDILDEALKELRVDVLNGKYDNF